MVKRVLWLLVAAGCGSYSPTLRDCSVKCSEEKTCPAGYECKTGYCRPPESLGACDCKPDDERKCGGGQGECKAGVQRCTPNGTWGVCVGEVKPMLEICDGKDNDCNGAADDSVTDAPPCPLNKGVCAGKTQACVNGAYSGTCENSVYGSQFQPTETTCDTLDNDCNGVADATATLKLLPQVYRYELSDFDGGMALVGQSIFSDGGWALIYQPLTATLSPKGTSHVVAETAERQQVFAIRGTADGVCVIHGDSSDGGELTSTINLTRVSETGQKTPYVPVSDAGMSGVPRLGVNAVSAVGAFVAERVTVRQVTWQVGSPSQAPSRLDYFLLPDGGLNGALEFDSDDVNLSPTALGLSILGENNDAGTSFSFVTSLRGPLRTSTAPIGSNIRLAETANGVSGAWNYWCDFTITFPIRTSCKRSEAHYKHDLFGSGAAAILKTVSDPASIRDVNQGRGPQGNVVVWTEKGGRLVVGTPFGNFMQARTRLIDGDGGVVAEPFVGSAAAGSLVGLTWRDGIGNTVGDVYGRMICQP